MKRLDLKPAASGSGFTIVELLIVIVVLAILAVITMVAYSGLQERAYAAKAAMIVDGYSKLVEMYRVDNNHYPFTDLPDETIEICLGKQSDYPAEGMFEAGECKKAPLPGGGSVNTTTNNDLAELLEPYALNLPSGQLPAVIFDTPIGDVGYRGVGYQIYDEVGSVRLSYVIKGKQKCPRGTTSYLLPTQGIDGTICEYALDGFAGQYDD